MKRYPLISLVCMVFSTGIYADTPLWLSEQPPDKSLLQQLQHAHGGLVHIENAVYSKQLWLRKGDDLRKSSYADRLTGVLQLMDTQQKITQPVIDQTVGSPAIRFDMPDEGFYNLYYIEQSVDNHVLKVATAKAEVLKHDCKQGHKYDRNLVNPNRWNDAPLDIIRLRLPKEDFHTQIQSGSVLKFNILHKGQPVSGAQVKLETQKGWVNTTTSDQNGIASFQIIQDNFPAVATEDQSFTGKLEADGVVQPKKAWADKKAGNEQRSKKQADEHAMRQSDNFLVTAEVITPEAGELDGKPYLQTAYSATLSGSYAPNTQSFKSQEQALMYAGAGFLTLGIAATVYRRRRIKPFKEEVFNEH